MTVSNLLLYQLLVVALVLICLMLHVWLPDASSIINPTPLKPDKIRRQRPNNGQSPAKRKV